MKREFEDEFMDIQADMVSLCLELYGEHPGDIIYIYVSNEKYSRMFNSFIRRDGQIKGMHELGVESSVIWKFLELGSADIKKLQTLCEEYGQPTPYEMKLQYDVSKGSLEADYKYVSQIPAKSNITAGDIFDNWVKEEKRR